MKNSVLLSFILGLAMSFASCDMFSDLIGDTDELTNPNRVEISVSDLPSVVTNYIATYYSEEAIESAATNLDDEGKMFYEVFTESGRELEFDLEGTFLREDTSETECTKGRKGKRGGCCGDDG